MAERQGKRPQGLTRREMLGKVPWALGTAVAVLIPWRSRTSRSEQVMDAPLPGPDSIFAPRHDARLEAWERQHGSGS
ncbi:MAG: hypothetical protein HY683_00340 [Chloroflexi bacterium]|nr:hypothetical protein [Chloroflexota bacterium]